MPEEKTTLATVTEFIQEVLGEECDEEEEIGLETSFSEDLELESIEFVALAEKIQAHYGDSVNFVSWLSEMDLDRIIGLSVGDLVEFIDACR